MPSAPVLVFGASGHTGRFVVDELARRGIPTVIAGRDRAKLAKLRAPTLVDARAAAIDAGSPGEIFDAADFLRALSPELAVERR